MRWMRRLPSPILSWTSEDRLRWCSAERGRAFAQGCATPAMMPRTFPCWGKSARSTSRHRRPLFCMRHLRQRRERAEGKSVKRLGGGGLSKLQHFPLNGGLEELGGIGDPDFLHHVCPMRLDSLDADFQSLSDFFIFESGPDQLKDFLFAGGQGFRTSFARREYRIRYRYFGFGFWWFSRLATCTSSSTSGKGNSQIEACDLPRQISMPDYTQCSWRL